MPIPLIYLLGCLMFFNQRIRPALSLHITMHEIIDINDVKFIFSPFKEIETASLGIFLKIGSRYEKEKLRGIAHFLEHLLFKGSNKYSHRKIKQEIEGRGGSLNGFTSHEMTGYYAYFLNKNLSSVLDILIDMVFNPLFKNEDIEKERSVILEEIKMYNDLPSARVVTLLDKSLWPDHPLGHDVIGYAHTVGNIKREDLVSFKDKYYNQSNMVVSCSGNFIRDKLINLLQKKIGRQLLKNIPIKTKAPAYLKGVHWKIEKKELEQVYLCLGFRSVAYQSRERVTAELLNIILGANMSSRLFEEIRERRALCYDISTELRKYKDSGAFVVQLGLAKNKVAVALSSILGELEKIKSKEVPLKELGRAKDFFTGQVSMALERPQGRMFYNVESYVNLAKINTPEEIRKEITAVMPFQIQRLAKEIFNFGNICISCVGDVAEKEENRINSFLRKFGFAVGR